MSALIARLDITMTVIVIDVYANLALLRREDSVILSAQVTKPMSMANVNATTEYLSITANALLPSSVLLTVNSIPQQTAVSANLVSQLLEANAQAINIVESMDILSMANATATMASSGSMVPADHVEPTKASTVSPANAISDTL